MARHVEFLGTPEKARDPLPKALHSFYLVCMSLGESNSSCMSEGRTPQRWTAEQWTEISPSGGNILDGTPQHLGEVIDLYLSWGYPPCGLTINWDAVITTLYLAVLEDGEVLGTVEPLRISRADA
jgi:hypothetical protein